MSYSLTKSIASILLSGFSLMGCGNAVDKELASIKEMQIDHVQIEWRITNEDESRMEAVFTSTQKDVKDKIREALSHVEKKSGSSWVTRKEVSIGRITLKGVNETVHTIDVTWSGYFLGGKRTLDALFYSHSLTKVIGELLTRSEDAENLVMDKKLFDVLSGKEREKR